jgi:hypothetical protein
MPCLRQTRGGEPISSGRDSSGQANKLKTIERFPPDSLADRQGFRNSLIPEFLNYETLILNIYERKKTHKK